MRYCNFINIKIIKKFVKIDIKITKFKNSKQFNNEEIYLSKLYLNGIYGIPALRAYFNNFKNVDNDYINFIDGYKNNERNLIFSIYVTSKALYNLLYPFKALNYDEIDKKFLYCDTDSLYFSDIKIFNKIKKLNIIDEFNIGYFSFDCRNITKFYILNHKKYCYYDNEHKKIKIRCGGVPLNSFNVEKYKSFDDFVKHEFHNKKSIKSKKSILNKQGTISIYSSETLIEKGNKYPIFFKSVNELFNAVNKEIDEDYEDGYFIESDIGVFSIHEIFSNEIKKNTALHINNMLFEVKKIKEYLNDKRAKKKNRIFKIK